MSVYEDLRRKRQEVIADLWSWHSSVCDCRKADGARCEHARLIAGTDIAMRKLEVGILAKVGTITVTP